MKRAQTGFTLLEVVVAMTVVGAGFAVGLAAMSGSMRLMRSAGEYEQAMLLGRSAMTEALAYPDYDIVQDREREVYQGVEYAYRVEFRPLRLPGTEASAGSAGSAPAAGAGSAATIAADALEQISVDVYWGKAPGRTYRLVTYRLRQSASETSQRHARGNAPAAAASTGAADPGGADTASAGQRLLAPRGADTRLLP